MPAFDLPIGAAFVVITATTAIIWTLLVLAVRLYLRLYINGPIGDDDYTCIAATVGDFRFSNPRDAMLTFRTKIVGIIQSSIVLAETHVGLGRHAEELSSKQLHQYAIMVWVHALLYLAAMALSKISVCLLIVRMTKTPKHLYAAYTIIACSSIWAAVAVLLVLFQCEMPEPWNTSGKCINRVKMWTAIQTVSIVLELLIFKTACFLVWDVHMKRRPKAVVLLAFAMRLLTIPPLVYAINVLHAALLTPDKSFSRVNVTIATQIVLHVSIMCATVPCIKPFLSLFNTRSTKPQLKRPMLPFHKGSKGSRGSSRRSDQLKDKKTERQPRGAARSTRPKFSRNESSAKWRDHIRMTTSETITTVEHVPFDATAPDKRKSISGISNGSRSEGSSNGIEWSRSFAVHYEDTLSKSQANGETRPDMIRRQSTQECTPTAFSPTTSRDRAG